MSHSDPYSIFVAPVKATIKAALVSAGVPELQISLNAVERNGTLGARVLTSKLPPQMDRVEEARPASRVNQPWTADDGTKWARGLRCTLVVCYQVEMWSENLSQATAFLFDFVRFLPRACFDQMPKGGLAVQPADEQGNRIELFPFAPVLPDDTTSSSKQYRSAVLVRAHGGIYLDKSILETVTVSTKLADSFAP